MEKVTIFIPLAGRPYCWMMLSEALSKQTYDHSAIKLILYNTSHSDKFENMVKKWMSRKDYETSYILDRKNIAGLADKPRPTPVVHQVFTYLSKIYSKIIPSIETPYIWFIDDDTIPPLDALSKLFDGFTINKVFSVSGAYRLRSPDWGFTAWMNPRRGFLQGGKGIQLIGGNGFGCALMKNFRNFNFSYDKRFSGGLDEQFYLREARKGRLAALNWNVTCKHMMASDKYIKLL